MKQIRSFGMLIFVGVLWWGLVYPELCFMEGTYELAATVTAKAIVVQQNGECQDESAEELLKGLFEAGPDRIIVKSEIMRKLSQ